MIRTRGWLGTLTGRDLLREEVRQVRRALDSIFGDHCVQIGDWGDPALFRRLARTRRTAVVSESRVAGADMVSATDMLAIASDSVDAVFLPHTLELADDPHGVLREVDRILRPDGHLVVLGFNPLGWWGLRHLLSRGRFPPDGARMISDRRLCDWLRLLDFSVQHADFYYHVPPVIRRLPRRPRGRRPRNHDGPAAAGCAEAGNQEFDGNVAADGFREAHVAARPARGAETSQRVLRELRPLWNWSVLAACYVLVARKELYIVTPIRPVWRRRATLVGGLVNPTTRNAA